MATFQRSKSSPNVRQVTPAVRGLLLVDLLRNPYAEWARIDYEKDAPNPNGYFIAAEDEERVKGLTKFTPSLAAKLLKAAAAGQISEDAALSPMPRPPGETAERLGNTVSTASPVSIAAHRTPTGRSKWGLPIWAWVAGIGVLIASAAFLLKRRR